MGIEFARIARRLQIFKDLFVNITKQMAFAGAGKVNFVQLVDHGAVAYRFHVVIGIAERLLYHVAAWVLSIGAVRFSTPGTDHH